MLLRERSHNEEIREWRGGGDMIAGATTTVIKLHQVPPQPPPRPQPPLVLEWSARHGKMPSRRPQRQWQNDGAVKKYMEAYHDQRVITTPSESVVNTSSSSLCIYYY
ncbi:Hypothetical predicted protein [Octopus vulgaris]|uniref:Uncharacterized protein n=1 Tax=Octopus vulgaris TaxID=6645 RepID=A0AA36FMF7_OCTVU|nr:Hypothetical predicted protein [Octopus vulgaris]